jgi:hypothetical protein
MRPSSALSILVRSQRTGANRFGAATEYRAATRHGRLLLFAAVLAVALLAATLSPAPRAEAAIPTMNRPACEPELHALPPSDRAAGG